MKTIRILLSLCLVLLWAQPAWAFCGFYVAKADTDLYNQASQVIIARDGDRTVLTMANDYQGEVQDFALVVPVPTLIEPEQVNVSNPSIIARLDAFSAPRLVEYFDEDPCAPVMSDRLVFESASPTSADPGSNSALGVTVESQFTVGEYDIVILSAKESNGLETWLRQNNYRIPAGANRLLRPYIRSGMKFFVAKVNLAEYDKDGLQQLRPLAIAYESPKFMLPIRLGMINSQGEQDLIVYLLSPQGQIELTNYRTVKIPSEFEVPEFVETEFANFYRAMFTQTHQKENRKVAFVEYAWNTANCDPCAAEPLNADELRQAGVFWLNYQPDNNVFITRLHLRYSRETFPEDLKFQTTANTDLFQGRYIIQHPYRDEIDCKDGEEYRQQVRQRQEQQARNLARITGWDINEIRRQIDFVEAQQIPWWRRIWR